MAQLKILIAAGGTGGHIYPALAIAEAFRSLRPDTRIEFVGTARGFENKVIPQQGYRLHHLPVGRLNNNVAPVERLRTVLQMPFAFFKSLQILRQEKPDFVLGVGGHASGPLLLVAACCGYFSAIWEPNAVPGLANRWLAWFVDDCWVVFEEAKALLHNRHLFLAGMPVRDEIEHVPEARTASVFRILVFGGSQGSRGINDKIVELVRDNPKWLTGVQIVHQTGASDFSRINNLYLQISPPPPIEVKEYLHNMAARYAAADLVICRAGTGTLFELAACAKPAILIPLPTAADDHQRKNAESLVAKGAALLLLQNELTSTSLREAIDSLRLSPERLRHMGQAIKTFHKPRAAESLVHEFVARIENHASR